MPPGRPPKPAATRQRRNRASTRSKLLAEAPAAIPPELPGVRDWNPLTRAWWADATGSPMAAEWVAADLHGLIRLAVLVDDFWAASTPSARSKLAAEIRLQQQAFGLSPLDRRRLEWEVARAEDAGEKPKRRRRGKDPRLALAK